MVSFNIPRRWAPNITWHDPDYFTKLYISPVSLYSYIGYNNLTELIFTCIFGYLRASVHQFTVTIIKKYDNNNIMQT